MLMKFIKRYAAVIIISFGLIEETHSRHPKDEESSQQTVEQVGNGLKLCAWRHCRFYRYLFWEPNVTKRTFSN